MNTYYVFALLLLILGFGTSTYAAEECPKGTTKRDGVCYLTRETFNYSFAGLVLSGSEAGGYKEESLGAWKKSKNGDRYEYTLSTKLDNGETINSKILTTWYKNGSSANFTEIFETINPNGVLVGKHIMTSDGSQYLRNCTQNLATKSLDCNIVTQAVCSAYQEQFKTMSAAEFQKCESLYNLVTLRKNEAQKAYDTRARMSIEAALKTAIPTQNYMNNSINIYSDIIECGRFAKLMGQPDAYKFETPLMKAQRAQYEKAAAQRAAASASGASGAGRGLVSGATGGTIGGNGGGLTAGQGGAGQR